MKWVMVTGIVRKMKLFAFKRKMPVGVGSYSHSGLEPAGLNGALSSHPSPVFSVCTHKSFAENPNRFRGSIKPPDASVGLCTSDYCSVCVSPYMQNLHTQCLLGHYYSANSSTMSSFLLLHLHIIPLPLRPLCQLDNGRLGWR